MSGNKKGLKKREKGEGIQEVIVIIVVIVSNSNSSSSSSIIVLIIITFANTKLIKKTFMWK